MLRSINKKYLIFAVLLFLFFLPRTSSEFLAVYLINFITIIVYFLFLNNQLTRNVGYYTKRRLAFFVFIYSLISVGIYNIISFYYRGNFFVFSEADALFYDSESRIMAGLNFFESIQYFLNTSSFEDLGAVLVISLLYNIVDSNLFVNLFYVLIGVLTALSLFRISKNFMSVKFSYLCSLTYATSSFVLWYHASGLKESFMVMLIVVFFDQFYQFYIKRKVWGLIYCIIPLIILLLFRPAIVFISIGAIGIGILLSKRITTFTLLSMILVFTMAIYLSNFFSETSSRYLYGSNDELMEIKENSGMVKGSVEFTYLVNILAGSIGPMPTISSGVDDDPATMKRVMLSFYSPGLIYRILLAIPFWLGILYIFVFKKVELYPLVLFYLLEMISLVYIMEALELRKSLPHFPIIYLITFWFLDKYNEPDLCSIKIKHRIRRLINFFSVLFVLLIIYWNFK